MRTRRGTGELRSRRTPARTERGLRQGLGGFGVPADPRAPWGRDQAVTRLSLSSFSDKPTAKIEPHPQYPREGEKLQLQCDGQGNPM